MKTLSFLFIVFISQTAFAQKPTAEQAKKEKILLSYIWQQADSSKGAHAGNQFRFFNEPDFKGFKGWFERDWQNFVMCWEWADKKATRMTLYIRYSYSLMDTLTLSNIQLTGKTLKADMYSTNKGRPQTGKLHYAAVKTTKEVDAEPRELEAIKID